MSGPRILLIDIETSPIIAYVWGLFDQNIALNQIKTDWHVLSWSAKWHGTPENEIIYFDQRNVKKIQDDKQILKKMWKLLDEADIVVGQNSKRFDVKKLNARFILHGMKPPSSYRQIDTLALSKKYFGFTSNKLEYTSKNLCTKYTKLKHTEFSGFELWKECLAGNKKAWEEMEKYNKQDVLALEELYNKLRSWDNSINFDVYRDDEQNLCSCGHPSFLKNGFRFTNAGKFQRLRCNQCGNEVISKENLLSKEKRKSLRK